MKCNRLPGVAGLIEEAALDLQQADLVLSEHPHGLVDVSLHHQEGRVVNADRAELGSLLQILLAEYVRLAEVRSLQRTPVHCEDCQLVNREQARRAYPARSCRRYL